MYGTFRIETAHATTLAVDIASQEVVHVPTDSIGDGRPVVFVHIPRESPVHAFFLFDNTSGLNIAFRHRKPSGPIITVQRNKLKEAAKFAFCDPHKRNYLLAHPDMAANRTGAAAFQGYGVAEWETFRLIDEGTVWPTAAIRYHLSLIQRVLSTPPERVLHLLREATPGDRTLLADLLAGTVAPAEAEWLAADLLANPGRLAEFISLVPGDPWAAAGLPALGRFVEAREMRSAKIQNEAAATWLPPPTNAPTVPAARPARRRIWSRWRAQPMTATLPAASGASSAVSGLALESVKPWRTIGRDLDRLASDGMEGGYTSLAHHCTIMARRNVVPKQDLCILTTARNEGLYLLDWIAYHRSVGVDGVFVYTNNNTDDSGELLRALATAGEISLVENELGPGSSPQGKTYGHALSMVPELLDYRWCAIIDVDEYIGFDTPRFASLKEYVAWQELHPVDAIALNWNVVGSSSALRWRDEPLPQRFGQRFPGADPHIKMMLRPRMFHHSGPSHGVTALFRSYAAMRPARCTGRVLPIPTRRSNPLPG